MATLSFYARGDSSTANNAALNVSGTSKTPTTLLTFTSGTTGDLRLDYNGGLADPDTQVIIGGQTLNFTLEFSGNLPATNKLANVGGTDLRGKQIAVITTSAGQRFFFVTDGSGTLAVMNGFPNGAHAIASVTNTTPVFMCFASGTLIATPDGLRKVESLRAGDLVLTADGRALPLRWHGALDFSATDLMLWPDLRPVVIPAHLFGPDLPARDLHLSGCHRIALSGWEVELLSGESGVLVPARHLIGHGAWQGDAGPVTYHHLYLDEHAVILSENLPTESFQPAARMVEALGARMRAKLESVMTAAVRPDAGLTLKRHESLVLLSQLLGGPHTERRPELPLAA
ncbi:Hint domain-containing protein [Paragemmobacter straminiformis]|uniref:Hint domain-containing protein n=1 Tax=Paragemmobacter straminiformis TaxID=2045119 RepID=A0A842IBA2_9RHOB|nr:Hint domain-containing protein [Gemmobacter straminiformis]MBC2837312.1 Hint domain-containing protein [Gemmobacter straminiformis]